MKNRRTYIRSLTLKAIVRAYIRRVRPRAQAELDWFRQQPSFRRALETAALALSSRGKRYSHQRRLKEAALEQALCVLSDKSRAMEQVRNFDDLFMLIESVLEPIPGIGELYVYDTSLRIGAKLNLLPAKVYLHAGTRLGARALGLDGGAATLEVSALPQEFCPLEPHEIEDILCVFKDEFRTAGAEVIAGHIAKGSWCS